MTAHRWPAHVELVLIYPPDPGASRGPDATRTATLPTLAELRTRRTPLDRSTPR